MQPSHGIISVGVVGARGYVGRELLRLIAAHPRLSLALAASGDRAGEPIRESVPEWPGDDLFVAPDAALFAERGGLTIFLALPNGSAPAFVDEFESSGGDAVLIDIGADHRHDRAWTYSIPEIDGGPAAGTMRIANPGCYATAMQLAIAPLRDLIVGHVCCAGVSGFSGAGATPSERNNPEMLRDNVLPYALAGHGHEREASARLDVDVRLAPLVAPFFRGLVVTAACSLLETADAHSLTARYKAFYSDSRLVRVLEHGVPSPAMMVGDPGAAIGGFAVDPHDARRVGLACAIDNLLKGAATQAVQNLNLALGFPMLEGILR